MQLLKILSDHLNKHIIENDLAKELIIDAFSYRWSVSNAKATKKSPVTFLLAGDNATGKTHTANVLADFFKQIDTEYETFTLDMSSFKNYNSGGDIIGSEKMYGNSGPGKLTAHLYKYPKSCIILENFDKAHHNVQERFLFAFQQGFLKDVYGFNKNIFESPLTNENYDTKLNENSIIFDIPCNRSIFILTTLEGEDFYKKSIFMERLKAKESAMKDIFLETVLKRNSTSDFGTFGFSPMIASLLQSAFFVPFVPLSFQALSLLLERHIASLKMFDCKLHVKDIKSIARALVLSSSPNFDLRKVLSLSQQKLLDPLLDQLREKGLNATKITVSIERTSKKFLQTLLDEIGEADILKTMFRKNHRLDINVTCTYANSTFLVQVHIDPILKKNVNPADYSGQSHGFVVDIPDVTFDDIAGHKFVKSKLKEIITYLKNPKKLEEFGIPLSKGMLLYGPPGTGKTMLAKAFAHEADLPFIATTGTEMLSLQKMHVIFDRAMQYAPSIIFIDEVDAIGRRDNSEKDPIINQFLTYINGFSHTKDEHVFIIAATNFKDKLDPAIVRSGRLDLHVEIPILDAEARGYFIDHILQKPTFGSFDKEKLIMFTAGMSGADLEKIARESSLEAIRKGAKGITQAMLIEQINILKYGERICSIALDKALKATAYHEAGHAVISKVLIPELKIEQIVVSPRNDALGFVAYNFEQDFSNFTYEDIKNRICVAYAGRLAQIEKFGDQGLDSGAQSDLGKATQLACYAIGSLGMDEDIGYMHLHIVQQTFGSHILGTQLQERIQRLLDAQKSRAQALIKKHWKEIENVAKALIEEEFLDEKEFYAILKK